MRASFFSRHDHTDPQTRVGFPPTGEWNEDDFDVLADGAVVGRILQVHAAPVGTPWMWTLAFGHHEDRTPTHGYEPTREAAMTAFATAFAAMHEPESALRPAILLVILGLGVNP